MLLKGLAAMILAGSALGQARDARPGRGGTRPVRGRWERWISEPRSGVLFILFSVLLLGGGRKLLKARRARAAVDRLEAADVSTASIADAAEHGRAGMMELFRILGSADAESQRDAAGRALSVLWARDEMIAEEEKALVRRGYQVHWKARRRYPRGLTAPIPIAVTYGVPFLSDDGRGVRPENLEWSHRITGARRASLEVFSLWVAGPGRAEFELIPSDFETDGPHKLVLQARARTVGLTGPWELELPHIPFSFEFDPRLAVDALFALPDDARAADFARAIRLAGQPPGPEETAAATGPPSFLFLNDGLAVRDMPAIEVTVPIHCDLSHAIEIEFEGVPGRYAAGELVLCGPDWKGKATGPERTFRFPLGPISPVPSGAIERPGPRPIRARLVPDPDRGWSDPEVRSIWPETIVTGWFEVEIVRR